MNRRRRSWIIATGLALVGAALAIVAHGAGPLPGDLRLSQAIQSIGTFDSAIGGVLTLLGKAIWPLATLTLIVALVVRRWTAALLLLVGGAGGLLLGEYVLKPLVARPRPSPDLLAVLDPTTSYGFPSSTSLLAAILAGLIVMLVPPQRQTLALVLGLVVVLITGLARVYVGEHWPTDIAASWCFAGAWLLVVRTVASRWSALSLDASHQ